MDFKKLIKALGFTPKKTLPAFLKRNILTRIIMLQQSIGNGDRKVLVTK